mmetsp:Transcript_19410/g.61810  ORF Transcript_19410/g.61810 Transcript_19410/m.61810 type:complete len:309 (+) Transcript_19410:2191-3117(+)
MRVGVLEATVRVVEALVGVEVRVLVRLRDVFTRVVRCRHTSLLSGRRSGATAVGEMDGHRHRHLLVGRRRSMPRVLRRGDELCGLRGAVRGAGGAAAVVPNDVHWLRLTDLAPRLCDGQRDVALPHQGVAREPRLNARPPQLHIGRIQHHLELAERDRGVAGILPPLLFLPLLGHGQREPRRLLLAACERSRVASSRLDDDALEIVLGRVERDGDPVHRLVLELFRAGAGCVLHGDDRRAPINPARPLVDALAEGVGHDRADTQHTRVAHGVEGGQKLARLVQLVPVVAGLVVHLDGPVRLLERLLHA